MRIDSGWYIIRARPRDSHLVHPGAGEAADVRTVPDLAKLATGAVAAINGGYFEVSTGKPQSMVAQCGVVQVPNYRGGDPYIAVTGDKVTFGTGNAPAGVDWALGGGPMLIESGRVVCPTAAQIEQRYPGTRSGQRIERTAIALTAAGELLLIVTKAATMAEVATEAVHLGATHALNLDGGGSTSLWYRGEPVVGCERKVCNAIAVVAEADEPAVGGLEIVQHIIPPGRRNRPGVLLDGPRYITVHDTGNSAKGAGAVSHGKYLDSPAGEDSMTSWHFTVDDQCVVQHLPIDEIAYHTGNTEGNRCSIGVEICENSDGDRTKTEANATDLIASLLKQLGLGVEAVVQHNRWNGKDCPHVLRFRPAGWDGFLAAVRARLASPPAAGAEKEQLRARVAELVGQLAADEIIIADLRGRIDAVKQLVAQWK